MLELQRPPGLMPPLQIVSTAAQLHEVRELRAARYRSIYPSIDVHADPYDETAVILFSRDGQGLVNGSARLVMDRELGLPEDAYFPPKVTEYRQSGLALMELGRFVIRGGGASLLKTYYRGFYEVATALGVDVILMAMKPKDVALHRHLMGAELLAENMGVSYGGPYSLACVAWNLARTHTRFFDWIGGVR